MYIVYMLNRTNGMMQLSIAFIRATKINFPLVCVPCLYMCVCVCVYLIWFYTESDTYTNIQNSVCTARTTKLFHNRFGRHIVQTILGVVQLSYPDSQRFDLHSTQKSTRISDTIFVRIFYFWCVVWGGGIVYRVWWCGGVQCSLRSLNCLENRETRSSVLGCTL